MSEAKSWKDLGLTLEESNNWKSKGYTIDKAITYQKWERAGFGISESDEWMKIESDHAKLYCGVRQGITLGAPIGLIIKNKVAKNCPPKIKRIISSTIKNQR